MVASLGFAGAQADEEFVERVVKQRKTAMAILRATTYDQTIETAAGDAKTALASLPAPPDDGVSVPGAPSMVVVTPYQRSLSVNWEAPPPTDYVRLSEVRLAPPAGGVIHEAATLGLTIFNLVGLREYTVEVRHTNVYGRAGAWSAPLTATPEQSVADLVDLAQTEIVGSLGWGNIDPLSAEFANKLGDGVVTGRAMAAVDAAFLKTWILDASISSAKIVNLAADKISAGTLSVAISITTGGSINLTGSGSMNMGSGSLNVTGGSIIVSNAGKFEIRDPTTPRLRLSTIGLELSPTSQTGDGFSLPSGATGRGVFPMDGNWGGIWPYDNATRRGWQMRADGLAGGKNGRLTLVATAADVYGPADVASYAHLIVSADPLSFTQTAISRAGVSITSGLVVDGPARVTGTIESGANLFAAGNISSSGFLSVNGGPSGAGRIQTSKSILELFASGRVDVLGSGGLDVKGAVTAAGLGVGSGNVAAANFNSGGATATFGGPVQLGGTLITNGQRVSPSEIGGITAVGAGASVALKSFSGWEALWVEVRWRIPGSDWRPARGSTSTTGVVLGGWNANGANVVNNTGGTIEAQAFFWR